MKKYLIKPKRKKKEQERESDMVKTLIRGR
jgi:hypothetical protein